MLYPRNLQIFKREIIQPSPQVCRLFVFDSKRVKGEKGTSRYILRQLFQLGSGYGSVKVSIYIAKKER